MTPYIRFDRDGNKMLVACAFLILFCGDARAETLQDAWKAGLEADFNLQASLAAEDVASEKLGAVRALRAPTVEVSGGLLKLETEPMLTASFGGLNATVPFADDEFAYFQAKVEMPLYTSGKISQNIEAAKAALRAGGFDVDSTRRSTKLAIANAYIAVLRTRQMKDVAEASLFSLETHLEDARNLYREGLVAKDTVLAAEVALASAQQDIIQANNAINLAEAAYNRRLGRPLESAVEIEDLEFVAVTEPLDVLTARALAERSELAALVAREEALRHQARAEKADLGPQLAITGGYASIDNPYFIDDDGWAVGVVARWKLFDAGSAKHLANAARHQSNELRYRRQEIASLIELEVRQAWLDLQAAQQRISLAEQTVVQAQESLRIAQNRFPEGLSTNADTLNAVAAAARSEMQLSLAVYDAVLARMMLLSATAQL